MPTSLPAKALTASRQASLWPKLALALVGPLLLLALSEGALRLFHFGRETSFFIRDQRAGFYRTNPRFTELFFPASFGLKPLNFRIEKQKPVGSMRIFVVGESAAMGVPEPGFGLAPQLEAQLRAAYPEKEIHVYNLGLTAINSHVIRRIVDEASGFDPDLFVIYMGNNEVVGPFGPSAAIANQMMPRPLIHLRLWLKASRVGQLIERVEIALTPQGHGFQDWRGMERFAGNTLSANDPRLAQVYTNFAANLHDILQTATHHGAKVVLSTVAVNLKFAPFVSRHQAAFTNAQQKHWDELELKAAEGTEFGEFDEANQALQQEKAIDPHFAQTHFERAELLAQFNHPQEAAAEYQEALEFDALRFRADAKINNLIREAARSDPQRIVLADTAKEWATSLAGSTALEDPRFFEHVHFRWPGNFALGHDLAQVAGRALFGPPVDDAAWLSSTQCADQLGYTALGRLALLQRMDVLTDRPPFTGESTFARERMRFATEIADAQAALNNRSGFDEAVAKLANAQAHNPNNPFLISVLALARSQSKDFSGALELLDRLGDLEPPSAEAYVQRAYVSLNLKQYSEAESILRAAAKDEPYYFQTYEMLAQLWLDTHQTDKAVAYFRALSERMPDSSGIRMTYAGLLNQTGNLQGAEMECRAVLAFAPDDETALSVMTRLLVQRHQQDEALAFMVRAYHYNPRNFKNNERLVEIFDQRGNLPQTVNYMESLAQSGPVNSELHQDLADRLLKLGRTTEARIETDRAHTTAMIESGAIAEPAAEF